MTRTSILLLALCLPLVAPLGAQADPQAQLRNSLTASGYNMAARYLDHVGDIDLNVLGGYVNFPTTRGSLAGGQFALQYRLADQLQLTANMGPLSEIGLRGPLWSHEGLTLGWDAHYRSDVYFYLKPGQGLSKAMGGMVPFPGAQSHGGELGLNAMVEWNALSGYATPVLDVMSNRSAAGLVAGLDYTLAGWELGLAGEYRNNFYNPADTGAAVVTHEFAGQAGMRYFLTDRSYIQACYRYAVADTYGIPTQQVLAGMGLRLAGSVKSVEPTPTPLPTPGSTPTPEATPIPTPVPTRIPSAAPAATPAPRTTGRLIGVMNGLSGNPPTWVQLKRLLGGSFQNIDTKATTDASGHVTFPDLAPGTYQIVYRNDGRPGTGGVAVSEAGVVSAGGTSTLSLDASWEDQVKETLEGDCMAVSWSLKAGALDALYQVVVRTAPDDSRTDVLSFPETPTEGTSGSFKVPSSVRGKKLYYFIKYWQKNGTFNGANYYGQSKIRTFDLK